MESTSVELVGPPSCHMLMHAHVCHCSVDQRYYHISQKKAPLMQFLSCRHPTIPPLTNFAGPCPFFPCSPLSGGTHKLHTSNPHKRIHSGGPRCPKAGGKCFLLINHSLMGPAKSWRLVSPWSQVPGIGIVLFTQTMQRNRVKVLWYSIMPFIFQRRGDAKTTHFPLRGNRAKHFKATCHMQTHC